MGGGQHPPALLLFPLDLQDYIDPRNRNHAFTLYSEVQKTNGQIEDDIYKCTIQLQTIHCEDHRIFVQRLRYSNRAVTTLTEQSQI